MTEKNKAIIEKYKGERSQAAFIRWINERECGLTYRTVFNWGKVTAKPHTSLLRVILATYPQDDPRHQFAAEMMEAGNDGRSNN